MTRLVWLLVLVACLGAAGCATTGGPPLTEEERCARFSGLWEAGACWGGSGGGGAM